MFSDAEWNWRAQVAAHSLGWVTARDDDPPGGPRGNTPIGPPSGSPTSAALVGFVNVVWDGEVHAWLQDVMVAADHQHHGVGRRLVEAARDGARAAGCEWLHVDFADELAPCYLDACGFSPTRAGLMAL